MFKHIQIVMGPTANGAKETVESVKAAEAEVRMAFAAKDLYEALFLCRRALLRSAQHEKGAIDAARYALIAATGEEP